MAPQPAALGDFGRNLKRAREAKRWTQKKLALKIGVADYNVSNWETRGVIPSFDTISALEGKLVVVGLMLPHREFLIKNLLENRYDDMLYFPITKNNADDYGIFEQHLEACLDGTEQSLHYTRLCEFARDSAPTRGVDEWKLPHEFHHQPFVRRLLANEIAWEQVEIFYSLTQLVQALTILEMLHGTRYDVQFYPAAPKSHPVINVESFDHKRFMIGGYDSKRTYRKNCILLGDREPMRDFLFNYWNAVWTAGQPQALSTQDSFSIAKSLNPSLSEMDWNGVTDEIKEDAARRRTQLAAFASSTP